MHHSRSWNCWSLRCSWSIACRRSSTFIFIRDLTPGFNGLGSDIYKTRRKTFKFGDLLRLILKVWWYMYTNGVHIYTFGSCFVAIYGHGMGGLWGFLWWAPSRGKHHGSALDGAVFDIAQILAYLVHNMSRSQLYLGFGHFGWLPSFFGQ